jgi:ABC-type transport system substrate-binding protein
LKERNESKGKREMKTIKMLAIATILLLLALMMARPASAVKGPVMDKLQFKFYSSEADLWSAFVAGDIDVMGSPITYDQYMEAATNPDILVAPCECASSHGILINNYKTIPTYPDWRSPTNYTEFRQAIACCVDKEGLISRVLKGMAVRMDVYMPPAEPSMINYNVCKYGPAGELLSNYPWEYDPTHALTILYSNGWYNTTIYPTYAAVLAAYQAGTLQADIGTTGGCVYPPGHQKAGQPLDPLICYDSNSPGSKELMAQLTGDLEKLGIPCSVAELLWAFSFQLTILQDRNYQLCTGGGSMDTGAPTWLYLFNPEMDYPGSYACWRVHDEDVTPWTEKVMNATSVDEAVEAAKMVEYYQVMRVYSIPICTDLECHAYRKGICSVSSGSVNTGWYGYGTRYGLDIPTMSMYSENYPTVNTVRYGTYYVPLCINPLFIWLAPDGQVADRIWAFPLASNPYNIGIGKSPTGGDLPWMAYDWNYQLSNFTGGGGQGNSSISYTNCANVTLWFRHDIKWTDGVPFTVDDLNESIALYKYYDDSLSYADALHVVNFVKIDDYTCSVYLDMPSVWSLHTVASFHIFPKHIYGFTSGKHHPLPTDADYYSGGPHGEWPWKDDNVTPVTDPAQVWVGCNLWKYVPGSYVSGAGGDILLEANSDFWMTVLPGEIDFNYYWNPGPPPQGGYYKIGLSDLVMLANAYGTEGTAPVPFKPLGAKGAWNPGADLAPPSGIIGLSDLVTLAKNYGKTWGTYP